MDDTGRRQEERSIDVLSDNFVHTTHVMLAMVIVLALLLLACLGVVVYQHKTFSAALQEEHEKYIRLLDEIETIETYEYDVEQEADDNGINYFAGRDLNYGGEAARARESDKDENP